MVTEGWLTKAERDAVTVPEFPPATSRDPRAARTATSTQIIKHEVGNTFKLPESDIDRGGLRIITTINKAKQAAVVTVRAYRPRRPRTVHAGLTSMKPGDGAIVAIYGGEDYTEAPAERVDRGHDAGRLDLQALHPDCGPPVR